MKNAGTTIQKILIGFGVLISSQVLASGDKLVQPLELKSLLTTKTQKNVFSPFVVNSKVEAVKLLGLQ